MPDGRLDTPKVGSYSGADPKDALLSDGSGSIQSRASLRKTTARRKMRQNVAVWSGEKRASTAGTPMRRRRRFPGRFADESIAEDAETEFRRVIKIEKSVSGELR